METKTQELIDMLFNDGPTDNMRLFESTIIKDIEWHLIVNNYHHDVVIQLYYGFNFLKERLEKVSNNPPHHWITNWSVCLKAIEYLKPELTKKEDQIEALDVKERIATRNTLTVEEMQNKYEFTSFYAVDSGGVMLRNLNPDTDFPMLFQQRFKYHLERFPNSTEKKFTRSELIDLKLKTSGRKKSDSLLTEEGRNNAAAYEIWLEEKDDRGAQNRTNHFSDYIIKGDKNKAIDYLKRHSNKPQKAMQILAAYIELNIIDVAIFSSATELERILNTVDGLNFSHQALDVNLKVYNGSNGKNNCDRFKEKVKRLLPDITAEIINK